jgi:hypothetical protein
VAVTVWLITRSARLQVPMLLAVRVATVTTVNWGAPAVPSTRSRRANGRNRRCETHHEDGGEDHDHTHEHG